MVSCAQLRLSACNFPLTPGTIVVAQHDFVMYGSPGHSMGTSLRLPHGNRASKLSYDQHNRENRGITLASSMTRPTAGRTSTPDCRARLQSSRTIGSESV